MKDKQDFFGNINAGVSLLFASSKEFEKLWNAGTLRLIENDIHRIESELQNIEDIRSDIQATLNKFKEIAKK